MSTSSRMISLHTLRQNTGISSSHVPTQQGRNVRYNNGAPSPSQSNLETDSDLFECLVEEILERKSDVL